MFKRIMVVLASTAAALALSAAPASADPEPGVLSLYEDTDFSGQEVHVWQSKIAPGTCSPMKAPLTTARSAQNLTIKTVVVYASLADCQADVDRLATLGPGGSNADFGAGTPSGSTPATHYKVVAPI